MDLTFFKRKKKKNEVNNYSDRNKDIKCKHCEISFESKERLKTHSRGAHTERGGGA